MEDPCLYRIRVELLEKLDEEIVETGFREVVYDKDRGIAINGHSVRLTLHTSPKGFLADGADISYLDVEVLDEQGRICPLCDSRIDFETEGEAVFLGGYNSVFLRSTFQADNIRVRAVLAGLPEAEVSWESVPVERKAISTNPSCQYDDRVHVLRIDLL